MLVKKSTGLFNYFFLVYMENSFLVLTEKQKFEWLL